MKRLITAALGFAILPMAALAQTYEKNDLPCVAEVCIGDGLENLNTIKWDRAKSPRSTARNPLYATARTTSATELKMLNVLYRGTVPKAAPYLASESFDAKALPLLKGITAACERRDLQGTYTTENGNPTTVSIALLPDKQDPKVQRWTVVTINRKFPAAKTYQQRADIQRELKTRYARFARMDRKTPTNGRFSMSSFGGVSASMFGFYLSLLQEQNEADSFMAHPACGGNKKISVD